METEFPSSQDYTGHNSSLGNHEILAFQLAIERGHLATGWQSFRWGISPFWESKEIVTGWWCFLGFSQKFAVLTMLTDWVVKASVINSFPESDLD